MVVYLCSIYHKRSDIEKRKSDIYTPMNQHLLKVLLNSLVVTIFLKSLKMRKKTSYFMIWQWQQLSNRCFCLFRLNEILETFECWSRVSVNASLVTFCGMSGMFEIGPNDRDKKFAMKNTYKQAYNYVFSVTTFRALRLKRHSC